MINIVWLLIGVLSQLFSNGRQIIPAAVVISMVFFLRFVRRSKPVPGILTGVVVNVAIAFYIFNGIIPLKGSLYYIVVGGMTAMSFLPYVADRLISPRIGGFASTLVFPLAWTALEYISSVANPYGTWSSIAYIQYDNLTFIQLASVTGIWGIIFMMTWFASVINHAWDRKWVWKDIRSGVVIYSCILAAVFVYGGVRLNLVQSGNKAVRIATITNTHEHAEKESVTNLEEIFNKDPDNFRSIILDLAKGVDGEFIERSRREADSGANIVAWSEGAVTIPAESEEAFTKRCRQLAIEKNIYLVAAMSVIPGEYPKTLCKNKVLLIEPSGKIMADYLKSRPVPGELCVSGNGKIPVISTQYGNISTAICFDMDFPSLIRQAGKGKADIMFVPSNDWETIDPLHTNMAVFRAIENGYSLVRIVNSGLSIAVDGMGRTIAQKDFFYSGDEAMISYIPKECNIPALYPVIGDLFGQLSVLGFWIFTITAIVRKKQVADDPGKGPSAQV